MRIFLQVVVDQENSDLVKEVQEQLLSLEPNLSFSPWRLQPSLRDCLEFYASASIEQKSLESLLKILNNDWDESENVYSAYGFNTKMFHPHVYYLQLEVRGRQA